MTPRTLRLTILAVVWAMILVTGVTWVVFTDPPDVPTGTAAAYATFIGGPLVAVIGLYKWARDKR